VVEDEVEEAASVAVVEEAASVAAAEQAASVAAAGGDSRVVQGSVAQDRPSGHRLAVERAAAARRHSPAGLPVVSAARVLAAAIAPASATVLASADDPA
jgi:hypothetical protein